MSGVYNCKGQYKNDMFVCPHDDYCEGCNCDAEDCFCEPSNLDHDNPNRRDTQ